MSIWDAVNATSLVDARMAAQAAQYDTSSGDSCWVRQYLEWCHPASATPAEKAMGCLIRQQERHE
jgi:hypothetical protein